jgi:hypothetical protein
MHAHATTHVCLLPSLCCTDVPCQSCLYSFVVSRPWPCEPACCPAARSAASGFWRRQACTALHSPFSRSTARAAPALATPSSGSSSATAVSTTLPLSALGHQLPHVRLAPCPCALAVVALLGAAAVLLRPPHARVVDSLPLASAQIALIRGCSMQAPLPHSSSRRPTASPPQMPAPMPVCPLPPWEPRCFALVIRDSWSTQTRFNASAARQGS